ncbi:MAG: hypothetical protein LAP21_28480, partial [Acidobacteriia bacterium]|nr:hypothetical protein [Terriglobia bacterium]
MSATYPEPGLSESNRGNQGASALVMAFAEDKQKAFTAKDAEEAQGKAKAGPLFMIRKQQIGSERRDGPGFRRWGFPWLPESGLGPRLYMDIATPPADQLASIASKAPAYVNTLP